MLKSHMFLHAVPVLLAVLCATSLSFSQTSQQNLDSQLRPLLRQAGFTGKVGNSLETRLGRKVDSNLAGLGKLLFFDTVTGLHDDNTCAGCHSPTNGFGDTQSIAIGIDNNGVAGKDRTGPRNQRRTPMVINAAFFPNLMWNSRFASLSGDPFDNSMGFIFPAPEGLTLSYLPHLLDAQAFIPPIERTEAAGFDFPGDNYALRDEVLRRISAIPAYKTLFGRSFPEVKTGSPITFDMFGKAIAEFEFTLVFANAPIDRYARGNNSAMTDQQKRGAILFFGKAGCVQCHSVSGQSNEMFSDFKEHGAGIPQIVPSTTNVVFDGPGQDEDFGLEQNTGNLADRYLFRTSPLRNVGLQPAFFHDGAFTRLEDAVRHHINTFQSARSYQPKGLAKDLQGPTGPVEPILAQVDPLLQVPLQLDGNEISDLVGFLADGFLDERARPENLQRLVPAKVPSGRPVLKFEF
jgi:cytochrome c peroxidase